MLEERFFRAALGRYACMPEWLTVEAISQYNNKQHMKGPSQLPSFWSYRATMQGMAFLIGQIEYGEAGSIKWQ